MAQDHDSTPPSRAGRPCARQRRRCGNSTGGRPCARQRRRRRSSVDLRCPPGLCC
uniref:Uncharacterized protein n=1 Tax=Maylandia zebra TaxID=106582 RepID=A0A3P9B0C0_9CICH